MRMPRINPHASAIKQDKQLREQMKWLKKHGFKNPRDAQNAGYQVIHMWGGAKVAYQAHNLELRVRIPTPQPNQENRMEQAVCPKCGKKLKGRYAISKHPVFCSGKRGKKGKEIKRWSTEQFLFRALRWEGTL